MRLRNGNGQIIHYTSLQLLKNWVFFLNFENWLFKLLIVLKVNFRNLKNLLNSYFLQFYVIRDNNIKYISIHFYKRFKILHSIRFYKPRFVLVNEMSHHMNGIFLQSLDWRVRFWFLYLLHFFLFLLHYEFHFL